MQQTNNLDISGIGKAPGGKYNDVYIQGVGKVLGEMECNSCKVEGTAKQIGNITAHTFDVQGKYKVKGNISSANMRVEGYLTATGNCDADVLKVNGGIKIGGMLNGGDISIRLIGFANINEIGGGRIHVKRGNGLGMFNRFKMLTTDTIEGDDIHLENTKANIIRGNNVYIGSGCEIGLVEYKQSFEQVKQSQVQEHRQL